MSGAGDMMAHAVERLDAALTESDRMQLLTVRTSVADCIC